MFLAYSIIHKPLLKPRDIYSVRSMIVASFLGLRLLLIFLLALTIRMAAAFGLRPTCSCAIRRQLMIRPMYHSGTRDEKNHRNYLHMASSSSTASSATKARRFYILRHGETDSNAADVIQGSSDVSRLTTKGREQASKIGLEAFCPITTKGEICSRITSVYVSPLTRARETLKIVRQSAPPHMLSSAEDTVLQELREIDFYSWENKSKDELKRKYPAEYAAWKAGDPDGLVVDGRQPLWETWQRASLVWDHIRSDVEKKALLEDQDADTATLLVCHGTLGQALLASAFGLDATIFRRNAFPNCGMAEIVWNTEEDVASAWRWHYPEPTERGCLRDQCFGGTIVR